MQLLPRKTHFNGSLEYQCKKHRRPLYPASTLPPSTGLRVSEYAPTARIRALSLRPLLDMAADLNPYWLSSLPSSWSYGVTRDGRIFFINEEAKSTTWLHPVTGEAVITGHRKTPDLPTGWEEGYTFEGARCFINHNERKVTCKHPVSGVPSQDNCIFVAPEQAPSQESDGVKKDRPTSTMSEASNYTGGSDYSTYPGSSPATRPSRSSKKVHNFGKRSNSIKRNPNAPAVKSNWLYKQDSTGMKLWKKRWFVLSDMCLFYYRDEKEEGILGSILLPSFHISMLSVDDHISRKYAFKATHPNMRTYYFCTDTVKEMESWMKVMTDAALVHTEPIRRLDKLKLDRGGPQEVNNILNHSRVLTRPEIQNNERNREPPQEVDKYGTLREGNRYGFQRDGSSERPLTKINSIKLQPAQAAAIAAAVNASRQGQTSQNVALQQVNGEQEGDPSPGEMIGTLGRGAGKAQVQGQNQAPEPERSLTRTNSMRQLENWVRTQRTREEEDDSRSITSYQTLPRNMPSHRAQVVPRYPEGYRTLPRNMLSRPESVCSVAGSVYDRTLAPASSSDKRRSMRDDTMWQLYEWQQRQAFSRHGPPPGHYGTLPSPKTMGNISEHQGAALSIPTSPSHGSLALYHTFSPPGQQHQDNPSGPARSEVSSPVFRGDQTMTIDRRHRTHLSKYNYPPDRRSVPTGIPVQTITVQSLQGKTMSPEDYRESVYSHPRPEDVDTDTKLSRLCEQDKVVRTQEDKVQQLHREKHTLETALLSASQEIEQSADSPAALQSLIQQRDVLQNGLLSTCRELSRVNNELERSWREYDKLESDVSLARTNLLEQLEALGSPQTEPPSQQHVRIQKELWRIQDVMEALAKNKPKRTSDTGERPLTLLRSLCPVQERNPVPPRPPLPHSYDSTERPPAVPPLPSPSGARSIAHANDTRKPGQRNGTHSGPDYRLYKSEPELTTVAEEMDDGNGDDGDKDRTQTEKVADKESTATKGVPVYPVGIVPPRSKSASSPPESCTIASYVTLRKTKKPDPRTDRPRSAVDQTGGPGERESGRGRMSVEEQLERIRRHQQASLRDKKRSSSCISPSRSPSFSKENPFFTQASPSSVPRSECVWGELEAALQDLEEVRDRVTEQLERDRTAAVELERDRAAELELERDRAAAAAEEELERGRAAIEKLERDMTEVAAAVEQEMARTALVVEGELEKGRTAVDEDRAAVVTEEELEMDRAAELELEKDREAVAAAAEELERARAAADELVRAKTAPSSAEELDVDSASLVELEMEITVVEEICYRAEEVDVIPVRRLLSLEEPQTQTERPGVGTEVQPNPLSHNTIEHNENPGTK
uniref:Pleckstrin homology domain-containing family A member 5-like n=1 Tax=Esox lucius TaxID=8010 RepID=A0A3P8YPN1_ESOLU